jgi:PmbA protein
VSGYAPSPLAQSLRSAVSRHPKVKAWQIRSLQRSGFQSYLVKTELESERRTDGETHDLTVFVDHQDLVGRASVTIAPGDAGGIDERVEAAVFMAGLGGDAPWALPGAAEWPKVAMFDPALSGDRARATSREIVEAWRAAAQPHANVRPSSMELFCGEDLTRLENSSGLVAQSSATRVSLLTLMLASGEHEAERISWDERRRVTDLDVAAIVRRAAEEANDLTRAVPPPSGQYPVVIDADEITGLLAPIESHASAESLYQKSSRFEVGKPLPIESKGGEPLTVISNAIAPYGLTSYAFDGSGVPGQRVEIVKDGVFGRPWATKQFADYLKTAPTGGFANWELPAGKTPLAQLTSGDRVLLVRSFSWLTPEPGRGNFGSEIRIGYLYENGIRKPVKGGTVSGNVFAALGTAHYSSDTVFHGDYLGPAGVRFEGLTIAGS